MCTINTAIIQLRSLLAFQNPQFLNNSIRKVALTCVVGFLWAFFEQLLNIRPKHFLCTAMPHSANTEHQVSCYVIELQKPDTFTENPMKLTAKLFGFFL